MSYTPSNHSKPWAEEEVSALERLLLEGRSPRDIARELGRTRGAVTAKANAVKTSRKVELDP
jgi:hypothetical protein